MLSLRLAAGLAAFCLVASVPYLAQTYPQAAPSGFNGETLEGGVPRTCATSGCHSSYTANSGTGGVSIVAPATVAPGETVPITVTVNNTTMPAAGSLTRQGFLASVRNHAQPVPGGEGDFVGTTEITDAVNTRRPFGGTSYVTHTETGTQQSSWTFNWTAPAAPTTATVYVAGNAANGGDLPDEPGNNAAGDYIYTATATIAVMVVAADEAPDARALSLSAPHPNPARGATSARLTLASVSSVAVTVVDGRGRTVRTQPTQALAAGTHVLRLATAGLAPGTYFVVVDADGARQTQALVVAR